METKKTKFAVRAIRDKVVICEPEHFVQLRITINGVSETIQCPHDFDIVIEALQRRNYAYIWNDPEQKFPYALQRLGMLRKTARSSWFGTKLFNLHAKALSQAFSQRFNRMTDRLYPDDDEQN